jgi:hypothetical protein
MIKSFDLIDKYEQSIARFRQDYLNEFSKYIYEPMKSIEEGRLRGWVRWGKDLCAGSSETFRDAEFILKQTYLELGFDITCPVMSGQGYEWEASPIK